MGSLHPSQQTHNEKLPTLLWKMQFEPIFNFFDFYKPNHRRKFCLEKFSPSTLSIKSHIYNRIDFNRKHMGSSLSNIRCTFAKLTNTLVGHEIKNAHCHAMDISQSSEYYTSRESTGHRCGRGGHGSRDNQQWKNNNGEQRQ